MSSMIIVPAAWVVYEIEDDVKEYAEVTTHASKTGVPGLAVMEALVATKKAKRLATVQTISGLIEGDEEDEGGSPFEDEDED
jgi:hypothetical protein